MGLLGAGRRGPLYNLRAYMVPLPEVSVFDIGISESLAVAGHHRVGAVCYFDIICLAAHAGKGGRVLNITAK